MNVSIANTIEIRDSGGQLCGSYHYDDPYKSFFRGLYTPGGKNVVASPPPDHPHHKGLQFGLCASDVNFWEEDETSEPQGRKLPIGKQQTKEVGILPPSEGVGFSQEVEWGREVCTFHETRRISVEKIPGAYVWTWWTTLVAARNVDLMTSVWPGPGYCGLVSALLPTCFRMARSRLLERHLAALRPACRFKAKERR
jgi:Methane oxygenase PmoA